MLFRSGPLEVESQGVISVSPTDAAAAGIVEGGRVKLISRIGSTSGSVKIDSNLSAGLIFAPYHFAELGIQGLFEDGCNRIGVQLEKG